MSHRVRPVDSVLPCLVSTVADSVDSMDAKFGFDDNADFRQKEIFKLRDITQEDPQEVEAAEVSSLLLVLRLCFR